MWLKNNFTPQTFMTMWEMEEEVNQHATAEGFLPLHVWLLLFIMPEAADYRIFNIPLFNEIFVVLMSMPIKHFRIVKLWCISMAKKSHWGIQINAWGPSHACCFSQKEHSVNLWICNYKQLILCSQPSFAVWRSVFLMLLYKILATHLRVEMAFCPI